jgi:hypothetical protein
MMGWPIVLGLISYIAIICGLTVWFVRHHLRNNQLREESFEAENQDEPDSPAPGPRQPEG